jgi:predicted HAD superfamily phosphohydrolase YqeG
MSDLTKLVAYVDVDDTLIRSVGPKRIPIPSVIAHVRQLHSAGVVLYCWSSGGAEYAREIARELDLTSCFVAFLPKPHVLLDDQAPAEWRRLRVVHPLDVSGDIDDYLTIL